MKNEYTIVTLMAHWRKASDFSPDVDGEWTMDNDNGEWTMDKGQWSMVNGQWTMDNGQWTRDNGQW